MRSQISRFSAPLLLAASIKLVNAQEWPDTGFNAAFWTPGWQSGYFIASALISEEAKAVVRTSDGSYIVAGRVLDPDSFVGVDIGLVKYRADGTVDTTFGGIANVHGIFVAGKPGEVLWDAYSTDVTDMTLDSLGRIIVVGPTPTGPAGDSDFGIVRFLADGSDVDRSFNSGVGGTSAGFDFGGDNNDSPVAVLVDAQNRIVVLGNISRGLGSCTGRRGFGMIRLDEYGELDSSFGNQSPPTGRTDMCHGDYDSFAAGFTPFPYPWLYSIAVTFGTTPTQTGMAFDYVDANGNTSQFSGGFDIPVPAGISSLRASALARQSPSELLVAGNAMSNDTPKSAVVCRIRHDDQGGGSTSFDPTFGPNCYVSASPDYDTVSSIAVHSDRSVELVGEYLSPISYPRGRTITLSPNGILPAISSGIWQAPRRSQPDLAFRTSFARLILDHDQPVIVGYRSDNSSSDADHDFVTLRLKTDLIFANDFEGPGE
jgi:hypothetical protein